MNIESTKVVFKCKHCENDDLRYMQFASLNKQSPQYMNHVYKNNWDYETTPKVPVGIHIRCAKCGKDTFVMPDSYNGTEWGNDIPEQCITQIKFEQPQFSAIQYVVSDDGFLDKIVITATNQKISLITQEQIPDTVVLSAISKKQYDIFMARGLPEVKGKPMVLPSAEIVTPPQTKSLAEQVSSISSNNKVEVEKK